jgi:hypothetical protein
VQPHPRRPSARPPASRRRAGRAAQDLRNNGFDPSDTTAGADPGAPTEEDQWEALEEKLKKARLKYESSYPLEERQFLGWPLD